MLGAEADADDVRGNPAQDRIALQELYNQGTPICLFAGEDAADDAVLNHHLDALHRARREFATALHGGEIVLGDGTVGRLLRRGV